MKERVLYFSLCAVAALVPLLNRGRLPVPAPTRAWPAAYDGVELRTVPLTEAERRFYADFPGAVARFTDGRREFILRWVTAPTRKLHPAADCFRGLGYVVSAGAPEVDARNRSWNCFAVSRDGQELRVRERISAVKGAESWTDVSAWYWSALWHPSAGPWLAVTIAEPAR